MRFSALARDPSFLSVYMVLSSGLRLEWRDIAPDAQTKRRDLYWALYKVWSNKPIVTVFGTVARADFWGPVADVAKGAGVQTEQITIVVDKVEKPRTRWYEEGLDEQPFNDRLLDGRVR